MFKESMVPSVPSSVENPDLQNGDHKKKKPLPQMGDGGDFTPEELGPIAERNPEIEEDSIESSPETTSHDALESVKWKKKKK